VPRSSKHVTEDQDYVLMSVVLFRRVVDDFKTAARVRGFQVRPAARLVGTLQAPLGHTWDLG
jgi:hypothetical protein